MGCVFRLPIRQEDSEDSVCSSRELLNWLGIHAAPIPSLDMRDHGPEGYWDLFDGHRLGQVSRLINIGSSLHTHVIGE